MPLRNESSAPLFDPTREEAAITRGSIRGIVGSLAGFAVALSTIIILEARWMGPSGRMVAEGLAALLPGACAGLAISWQCRRSPWRLALAAVGPALVFAFTFGIEFLVLIGFQAHADLIGYFIGSGIVFALAGAMAAVCLVPVLRLGSARAGAELVLTAAVSFMIGGLAHGAIVSFAFSLAASTTIGRSFNLLLLVPLGFALALVCGWGGLGAGAQRIQARSRRDQAPDPDAAPSC